MIEAKGPPKSLDKKSGFVYSVYVVRDSSSTIVLLPSRHPLGPNLANQRELYRTTRRAKGGPLSFPPRDVGVSMAINRNQSDLIRHKHQGAFALRLLSPSGKSPASKGADSGQRATSLLSPDSVISPTLSSCIRTSGEKRCAYMQESDLQEHADDEHGREE
jgi:hypothetical protein